MAQTIKEQIVQKIAATLATVSGVQSVQRMTQQGPSFATVPTVVLTQGDDLLDGDQTYQAVSRLLTMYASVVTRQTDKTDTRSGDEVLNTLGGDIEAAVQSDRTCGGLAWESSSPDWLEVVIESQVPSIGLALRWTVKYRHLRSDPYNQ